MNVNQADSYKVGNLNVSLNSETTAADTKWTPGGVNAPQEHGTLTWTSDEKTPARTVRYVAPSYTYGGTGFKDACVKIGKIFKLIKDVDIGEGDKKKTVRVWHTAVNALAKEGKVDVKRDNETVGKYHFEKKSGPSTAGSNSTKTGSEGAGNIAIVGVAPAMEKEGFLGRTLGVKQKLIEFDVSEEDQDRIFDEAFKLYEAKGTRGTTLEIRNLHNELFKMHMEYNTENERIEFSVVENGNYRSLGDPSDTKTPMNDLENFIEKTPGLNERLKTAECDIAVYSEGIRKGSVYVERRIKYVREPHALQSVIQKPLGAIIPERIEDIRSSIPVKGNDGKNYQFVTFGEGRGRRYGLIQLEGEWEVKLKVQSDPTNNGAGSYTRTLKQKEGLEGASSEGLEGASSEGLEGASSTESGYKIVTRPKSNLLTFEKIVDSSELGGAADSSGLMENSLLPPGGLTPMGKVTEEAVPPGRTKLPRMIMITAKIPLHDQKILEKYGCTVSREGGRTRVDLKPDSLYVFKDSGDNQHFGLYLAEDDSNPRPIMTIDRTYGTVSGVVAGVGGYQQLWVKADSQEKHS